MRYFCVLFVTVFLCAQEMQLQLQVVGVDQNNGYFQLQTSTQSPVELIPGDRVIISITGSNSLDLATYKSTWRWIRKYKKGKKKIRKIYLQDVTDIVKGNLGTSIALWAVAFKDMQKFVQKEFSHSPQQHQLRITDPCYLEVSGHADYRLHHPSTHQGTRIKGPELVSKLENNKVWYSVKITIYRVD